MKNFLIVGTQRIGSTVLGQSIGLHPKIAAGVEWTLSVPAHRKVHVMERIFAADFSVLSKGQQERAAKLMGPQTEWLGFRCLFRASDKWLLHPRYAPAIWLDRLEGHIRWLGKHRHARIIHIVRRDNVAWLRSKVLLAKLEHDRRKPYPEGMKVVVPLKEAKARSRAKDWVDSRLSSLAKTNPYLRIYYEDFLANPDETIGSMLRFLDCDPKDIEGRKARVSKQSHERIDDQVVNYRELVGALEDSNLRWSGLGGR
jgi:hypothetical protein